jgi:AAA+ superfamily predicted ATPase
LTKWKGKFLDEKTRITVIGCTCDPESGSKKEFRKFFDKAIYFPFPDYTTRRLMWKNFIESSGGKLPQDFPVSTIAHISSGYSAGSIKQTVEKVLTDYRIKHQDHNPLTLAEFVGPLSQCNNTMDDQYQELKDFTDFISRDGERRKNLEKEQAGEGGGDGKPKPKKKK